ncbi:Uncharacterized protein TCAP_07556, partial [Tolypocladium capitatum]
PPRTGAIAARCSWLRLLQPHPAPSFHPRRLWPRWRFLQITLPCRRRTSEASSSQLAGRARHTTHHHGHAIRQTDIHGHDDTHRRISRHRRRPRSHGGDNQQDAPDQLQVADDPAHSLTAPLPQVREAAEISNSPSPDYMAEPLESDLFEWHFTLRGPPNSVYGQGLYHGRIVLPPTYPLRPPSFRFTTPNGRFEANREICLSISGHHEETWQPAWGIRTALVAYVPAHHR